MREARRSALADRDAIFDHIEADSPRAAVTVDERIEEAAQQLVDFPEIGRLKQRTLNSPRLNIGDVRI